MSVRILTGDCRDVLRSLPDESVNCCVTSPPYFGLRDYGVNGQIGLEETPAAFVAEMVSVFREVRRVLRKDGTLWLNLGDSYAGSRCGEQGASGQIADRSVAAARCRSLNKTAAGALKAKDRMMIPARVAIALQEDGWYLRDEIVWHKPNPMPSSVTDRTTPAHEMLYMLSRSSRYAYDADAIKEPSVSGHPSGNGFARPQQVARGGRGNAEQWQPVRPQAVRAREIAAEKGLTEAHIAAIKAVGITDVGKAQTTQDGFGKNTAEMMRLAAEAKVALGGYYREFLIAEMRNKRSVWTVPVMPFSEAHFATFPADLITDAIKAGCPAGGTVLDPFGGAGTTALVADRLGRDAILIELNPAYATMARDRLARDGGMFASVAAE
jgi:DNA modification methylase